ncbi:hypothetical protein RhiirA4_545862 [Rhizophagus irregularis]|uniref:Crinkler effector protein N-terminal domain-containing protein n=1 Tax=Rhizophagus irregularis TaxID=588596 RepID=A0A2I1GUQ7_9GLOM|nr:hypothetical protein RhiirA4_545862 [Rhizophagus irregularis]
MYSENIFKMVFPLNCLFLGDAPARAIQVKISDEIIVDNCTINYEDITVSDVKSLILSKKGVSYSPDNLNLWKVDRDSVIKNNELLRTFSTENDIKEKLGGELMQPRLSLDEYFNEDSFKDKKSKSAIHIIVQRLTTTTELERKRKNTEVETTSRKRREWAVNSTIRNEISGSVYFVDPAETSRPLFDMIKKGEFVALYGARASGKSTRVDQIMIELKSEGYVCIYVSFEGVNMSTLSTFWSSIGAKLVINAPKYFELDKVKSADDFMLKFRKGPWKDKHVVLFIDEYDSLLEANDDIRSSFLGAIRNIKNSKRDYAIWSSVAIGPLSILFLKSDKINVSPFNVKEPFRNPNFTLAQVESIYKDYVDDNKLTIAPEVIKDIYERTNGHAGLVCLCGRAIQNNLEKKLDESRRLDFTLWSNFLATSRVTDIMIRYITFNKMVSDLSKPKAKEALDLLRSVFLGFFDFVKIEATEERRLADFLTTMGVLVRDNENGFSYKMSSMLIDRLIRRDVISELYNSRPTVPVPQTHEGSLKIIDTLIEAALVEVDGYLHTKVPRESVYDTELYRILVNWIVNECNFVVTGQHHLIDHVDNDEKGKHYYSDITIMSEDQTAVLELLASATKNELNEHFERILNYAEMLSANDIWIVNFTGEDNATKQPHWPPNDGKFESVNVFHDRKFENIRMSTRYVTFNSANTFSYIIDRVF